MGKPTGPTNVLLLELIKELKILSIKEKVGLWKALALELEKSERLKKPVNVSKIDKYTKKGDIVVVPGKILADGELKKDVTVAAFQFSEAAKTKIKNRMSIQDLMKKNPKGKSLMIIK